jgi:anti-sigma B factor antagonist
MAATKLAIAERDVQGVTVLTLSGEMVLDDGDLAFGRRISSLVEQGRLKIVVDLEGVSYIDSSGVGMMTATLKEVRKHRGDIRLMRLNTQGHRLFSVLKLKTTFEVFDDEAVALKSFEFRPSG